MLIKSSRRVHDGFFKLDVLETDQGKREVVRATDSVNVLIHDTLNDAVLLVREERPAMITPENPNGLLVGTVAGRFDVNLGVLALAVKEVWEEVRVRVEEKGIILLNEGVPMAVNPGMTNEKAYLTYVEIDPRNVEPNQKHFGARGEGERTERVWVPVKDLDTMVWQDVRVYALIQRLLRKLERDRRSESRSSGASPNSGEAG